MDEKARSNDNQQENETEGDSSNAEQNNATKNKPRMSPRGRRTGAWKHTTIANRLTAIFTGMTAFATVVACFMYWGQVRAMNNQVKAMNDQLSVMSGTLDQMQKAANLEYRPWVGVSTVSITQFVVGQKIQCVFVFTNTGKTPASGVRPTSTLKEGLPGADVKEFLREDIREDFAAFFDSQSPGIEMTLAPNATSKYLATSAFELSDQILANIKTGKTALYVFGVVLYDDVYGVRHKTQFCHTIDPESRNLTQYSQFNEMD